MPATVTANTPVATFSRFVRESDDPKYQACQEAIDWLGAARFKQQKMQFVMDTYVAENTPDLPYEGWAVWTLHLWRQYLDSFMRERFLAVIYDPMSAYQLLKLSPDDPAGYDWTKTELAAIRAKFRGKLPNVPDSETL